MYFRGRHLLVLGGTAALAIIVVLGGVIVTGQAATVQKVSAALACEPGTVNPKTGQHDWLCADRDQRKAETASRASSSPLRHQAAHSARPRRLCTPSGITLTCNIGKLTAAGMPGSTFSETHELDVPSTGASVTQTVTGKYSSPSGNNRGSAVISVPPPNPVSTLLDSSTDFDAKSAHGNGANVQTGTTITLGEQSLQHWGDSFRRRRASRQACRSVSATQLLQTLQTVPAAASAGR